MTVAVTTTPSRRLVTSPSSRSLRRPPTVLGVPGASSASIKQRIEKGGDYGEGVVERARDRQQRPARLCRVASLPQHSVGDTKTHRQRDSTPVLLGPERRQLRFHID